MIHYVEELSRRPTSKPQGIAFVGEVIALLPQNAQRVSEATAELHKRGGSAPRRRDRAYRGVDASTLRRIKDILGRQPGGAAGGRRQTGCGVSAGMN
jgi:hypothetical protein